MKAPTATRSTAPATSRIRSTSIHDLTADVEVGKVYEGPVLRPLDFGAVVQLMPGRDGLIVKVKVLEADDKGRVRLSMKAVNQQEQAAKENAWLLALPRKAGSADPVSARRFPSCSDQRRGRVARM